ncbi:MAG: hypothetical protein JEZ07_06370 [Phycisphaerae bacterium]|nr:hypothetical protein [Phycisphaerae bacterium]
MNAKEKMELKQRNEAIARMELRQIDEQLVVRGCPRRALQVIAQLKVKSDRKVSDGKLSAYKKFIEEYQKRKAQQVNDCNILGVH